MYRIAVAGCGVMSNAWIKAASQRDDCLIAALVDINIDSAKERNELNKLGAKVYTNLQEAVEKENIDLVFDITPPEHHFSTVTTALKAGCNVFGEKPMSDSLECAYKMIECSDEMGKEYFVMQNRRYIPHICGFHDFLVSNKLGKPGQLSANFQLNPHFGGFREEMESPLLADMAIHTFDAARFILGKNPVSVYCHEFNPSWSWYDGCANAVCIFEMDDGTIFDYRGSWCANGLNTSWESEWRATCADGSVFWDGFDKLYYNVPDLNIKKFGIDDDEITEPLSGILPVNMEKIGHEACITEMFDSLNNNKRPQTDCRDNIKSIEMVFKAIESAKNQKKIYFK